jgi:hypothetical protein
MHRISLPVLLIALLACTTAEARTWRPKHQAPITGEFAGVNGDKVQIQTRGGITEISYLSLNRADRALVKSSLQIQGRSEEANRLVTLETSGSTATTPAAPATNGEPSAEGTPDSTSGAGPRTWRDINGRELQAEFISANAQTVTLRVNGNVQSFPLIGFSQSDRDWIATQQGAEGSEATEGGISFSGAMPPGMSSSGTGASGMSQPGFNFPGFPGSSTDPNRGMPPATGMPPGMSMPPGMTMAPGMSMPPAMSGPQGGQFPQSSTPPQFPDSSMPGGGGSGSFPQQQPQFPQSQFPEPSFPEPQFPEPNFPEFTPPEMPQTNFEVPQFGFVMKCDQCGTEFTEADGVKVGDSCPKCSSGGGGFHMRSTRGLFKGIGFLIAVVVGAVGWVIKKMNGSE